MAPRSYDEAKLGPTVLPERWWFTMSSARRSRIREAADIPATPTHLYIGAIQDKLIAAGKGQLASRFMRAMQEAHDADEAKAKEEAESAEMEREQEFARVFGAPAQGPYSSVPWIDPGQPE